MAPRRLGDFLQSICLSNLPGFFRQKQCFHADKWNFGARLEALLTRRRILAGVSFCSLYVCGRQLAEPGWEKMPKSNVPSVPSPWASWAAAPAVRQTARRDVLAGWRDAVAPWGVPRELRFSPGPSMPAVGIVCLCWFYRFYP